jgi:hypothetical protein
MPMLMWLGVGGASVVAVVVSVLGAAVVAVVASVVATVVAVEAAVVTVESSSPPQAPRQKTSATATSKKVTLRYLIGSPLDLSVV